MRADLLTKRRILKLKLFHGSNIEIENIDFDKCRPCKDFGKGLYLTTIEDQAVKMAKRVSRIYGGEPVVTAFSFDMDSIGDDLTVKVFGKADADWAIFVLNNRNREFADISSKD